MRIVPEGVTAQDCVAEVAPGAFAVTVKLLSVRDCCVVGVQETVFPLSVAPAGAFDKENETALPMATS
jgi:hypothetical protein